MGEWRLIYSDGFNQVEEALETSQKCYQSLVESSTDHIFLLSAEGVYLTSNSRVDQFGFDQASQLTGRKLEEVYPPEIAESYRQQLERVFATGLTVEFEHPMTQPDGEHTHLDTLYPIYRYGLIWAVGGICHDISERKRAERHCEALSERFQAVFEHSQDPIYFKDRRLQYTLVNPAMEKIAGMPAQQMLGKDDAQLFGGAMAAALAEADARALEGETVAGEALLPFNGGPHSFQLLEKPLWDESGQISGVFCIARDKSLQKR